jgi:ankyrin repeat protein
MADKKLQQATQNGDVAEMRRLVANGRDVNERDADGLAALHVAAVNGDVEVIRVLVVELGADKDAKDAAGQAALHYAAATGHVEAIKALVQLGVNKDAKNANGETLYIAAFNGHVEAIKALEQLGAQIDAQAADGQTPLDVSIGEGHHQAAQVLRELERTARTRKEAAGQADRTAAGRGSVEATAAASQAGACAACGSSSGASDAPLKICSRCQSVKYCSALCQRTHWPAHKVSCAAAVAAGSGGGASTTQASGRAGTLAAGSLRQAAGRGDVAEVRRLVASGVNVEEPDADGDMAMHLAAEHGHAEVLRVLVELGADKEAKNAAGLTASVWLSLATWRRCERWSTPVWTRTRIMLVDALHCTSLRSTGGAC